MTSELTHTQDDILSSESLHAGLDNSSELSSDRPLGGVFKRLFDIIFSLSALISLAPLLALMMVTLKVAGKGPVFFMHERVGWNGKKFRCIKFRTMIVDGDAVLRNYFANNPDAREEYKRDHKLKNDPRIIPVIGHFLRSTSLDELPQFFNVLRGDMSIVGPRPVIDEELQAYGNTALCYIRTRPGITGLWQVSGRNDLSFAQRVTIDHQYVTKWSFWLDISIIFRTISVLASGKGAC